MTRPFVLGRDHKLYIHNPAASRGAANDPSAWSAFVAAGGIARLDLMSSVQDVTVSLSNETAEAATRASGKWAQNVVVTGSITIDFSVLWKPSDANFQVMLARYIDGCTWAFAVADADLTAPAASCDGTVTASYVLWADYVLTSFDWNQPRAEPATADVTLESALGIITPEINQVI